MRNYKGVQPWAIAALNRDNYRCQRCPSETIDVVVHHLDESRKLGITNMNNELSNLITLCRKCHAKIHKYHIRYKDMQKQNAVKALRREGLTFQGIANQLGISRQRAHQIYAYIAS